MDVQLLPNLFSQMELDQLAQIPLTRTTSEDSLFWPYVQSGQYTTKSGYYFLKTEVLDGELAIPFPSRADETTLEENMEFISAV